jgi:DNA-binding NtrC family response regulator
MATSSLLKISHIDDDPQMRAMMADFIKEKYPAAEMTTYSTGEEALQSITANRDLIILDYNLDSVNTGGVNGIEVFKKLKQRLPDSPVIFISAQKESEVANDAIMSGAMDYIVKNEKIFQTLEVTLNSMLGKTEKEETDDGKRKPMTALLIAAIIILVGIIIWQNIK